MRFCEEHMSEEQRTVIARELFEVKEVLKGKGELHGLCPAHDDRNKPSFSYNYKKDLCNCMVCGFSGDLVELWCHANGMKRDMGGFKAFCQAFHINASSDHAPTSATQSKPADAPPQKKPSEAKPVKQSTKKESDAADDEPLQPIPWDQFNALPPLPEDWIERLAKERGWTREVMERQQLRQYVHTRENAKLFRVSRMPFGQRRVAIPIPDDAGDLVNIRFYLPWDRSEDDEKVMSCAGRGEARLYPPPSQWGAGPLWQVEGEPDLICGLSQGLNAVTKTTGVKVWKEEWNQHFEGREVVNAYDADKPGMQGNERVGKDLAPITKLFRYLRWPGFMYEGTDQPLDDPKQKFSEFVLTEARMWPVKGGKDLTDWFVKHGRCVADLKDLLATAGTIAPPDQKPALGPRRFFGGRNGNAFKPALLAEAILEDTDVISDPETGLIYKWNERFWERFNLAYIQKRALLMLEREASTARASDVATMVRILSSMEPGRRMDDSLEWICLKNCLFNLESGITAQHSHDYYFSYMLGVEFNPNASPRCDRWLAFLAETVQDPVTIMAMQEFFGYCLTNNTIYEKCLFLYGPGSDGKSKVINVLSALLGEQNCAAVGLKDLEKEFYRASLLGKKLNVSAEFDSGAFTSEWFKKLITGDLISAAFKHKDFFEFRFTGKLVFASNRFPKVLDNTDGYWRRLLPIRFKKQFLTVSDGKDIHLEKTLLSELDGIFAWALAGLERLYEQGEFSWSDDMEDTLNEYKSTNDPVLVFVQERLLCRESDTSRVGVAALYKAYLRFCSEGNFSPHNRIHFGREFKRCVPHVTKGKLHGTRDEAWIGISLLDVDGSSSPAPLPSGSATSG